MARSCGVSPVRTAVLLRCCDGGRARARARCTAGMPTPSYAAPHTASPGHARDVGADPGDPVEVADGVLRQRRRPTAARARRRGGQRAAERLAEVGEATATSSSSARWRAASSRCRPTEVRRSTTSSAPRRTQAHLPKENVDALIVRPSTGGTRKPEPGSVVDARARHGQRDHRHRGVLDRRRARRRRRRGDVASSRAAGAAGMASDDRVRLDHLGRPRPSRRRAASRSPCAAARGRAHRCAASRHVGDLVGDEPGQAPTPPRRPGEQRRGAVRAAGRGCRGARRGRPGSAAVAARPELRHGRPRGQPPGVAGVHPAEQRLDEPVDDLVAEPGRDLVADRDVLVERRRRGQGSRARSRATSRGEHPARPSSRVGGHAHQRARGSGRRAPRVQTEADGRRRGDQSSAAPTRARGRRPRAAGRASPRHRRRRVPGDRSRRSLPPSRSPPSSTVTCGRARVEHVERGGQAGDAAADDDDVGPGGHGRDNCHPASHARPEPSTGPGPGQAGGARRQTPGPA